MIDGITILSTNTVKVMGWGWTQLGFITFMIFLVCVAVILFCFRNSYDGEGGIPLTALFIGIICIVICFIDCSLEAVKQQYDVYKVTIDESVSMIDFTNKYEIISQEGVIYEIKERPTE